MNNLISRSSVIEEGNEKTEKKEDQLSPSNPFWEFCQWLSREYTGTCSQLVQVQREHGLTIMSRFLCIKSLTAMLISFIAMSTHLKQVVSFDLFTRCSGTQWKRVPGISMKA